MIFCLPVTSFLIGPYLVSVVNALYPSQLPSKKFLHRKISELYTGNVEYQS